MGLHAVPKDEGPFVHALNTEGFALCIDLPAAARSGPAAAREWGLALAPGDGDLYAANPALGLVVEIDADEGRVRARRRIPRGAIGAPPRLAVAPDGATLYVPSAGGVVAVATATLSPRATLLRGHRVSAVLARGRRLFVQDGAVATLDAASGRCSAARRRPRRRRRSRPWCRRGRSCRWRLRRCAAKGITEGRRPRGARPGRPGGSVLDRCRRTTLSQHSWPRC